MVDVTRRKIRQLEQNGKICVIWKWRLGLNDFVLLFAVVIIAHLCNHYRKVNRFNRFVNTIFCRKILELNCVLRSLTRRAFNIFSILPVFSPCRQRLNFASQSQCDRVNCCLLQRPRLHSPGDNVCGQRSCSRQQRSSSAYRPTSLYSVAIEPK